MTEWSSEEGRRSDRMTHFTRLYLFHPRYGVMRSEGVILPLKQLAAQIAFACGVGRAQTFRRYLEEYIAVGLLRSFKDAGVECVERTDMPYPISRLGLEEETNGDSFKPRRDVARWSNDR